MNISWELFEVQSAFPFKISRAIEDVVTRVLRHLAVIGMPVPGMVSLG